MQHRLTSQRINNQTQNPKEKKNTSNSTRHKDLKINNQIEQNNQANSRTHPNNNLIST